MQSNRLTSTRSLAGVLAGSALLAACGAAAPGELPDMAFTEDTVAAEAADRPPARRLAIGRALGADDAPLVVVEFSDPGCYSCSTFAVQSFPELKREFIDTGRVQWRTVLLDRGFSNGVPAARAAACAAQQDAFWEMRLNLAAQQRDWIVSRNPETRFTEYATELGLDAPAFQDCQETFPAAAGMSLEEMVALQLGVRAVPMFMVGNQRVLGALRTEDFRAVILRELDG
jgi:protein-disulfide isomerase